MRKKRNVFKIVIYIMLFAMVMSTLLMSFSLFFQ